jgi:hypothetical protein
MGRMNPSLGLGCRHPGDRYPFHRGFGICLMNGYKKRAGRSGNRAL